MDVNELIVKLSSLSKEELIEIDRALTKEFKKFLQIDEDLFKFLLTEMGEKPVSALKFSKTSNGQRWLNSQAGFEQVFNEIIEGNTYRQVQLLALKKFLSDLLIQDLKDRRVPVDIGSVCNSLRYFTQVFDRAFPSYRRNQLGPLIMSKLKGRFKDAKD